MAKAVVARAAMAGTSAATVRIHPEAVGTGVETVGPNAEVARRFEEAAAIYDAVSNPYTMRRRAEALAAWVIGKSIEVGGGTGAVTLRLSDSRRVIHSDIAPSMCKLAREKLGRPSVCFDAQRPPLGEGSFDSIVAAEMIYYLRDPQQFVSHAWRILRPGGRLILSTTNPLMTAVERGRSMLRRLGFGRMFFDDGSPRFPGLAEVCGMLCRRGFQIEYCGGVAPLPFAFCDGLNRLLERTPAWRLSLFFVIVGKKPVGR